MYYFMNKKGCQFFTNCMCDATHYKYFITVLSATNNVFKTYSLYSCRRNDFVISMVVHFTAIDVNFFVSGRFLKKGFCRNYILDVSFHVGVR